MSCRGRLGVGWLGGEVGAPSEFSQIDRARVDAVVAGIERLENLHIIELKEEIAHHLGAHYQPLADLRVAGLGKLAD